MKNLFLGFILFFATSVDAQTVDFGVKAGLGIDTNSETSLNSVTTSTIDAGSSQLNFHAGFFGNIGIAGWFIQPEVYYTQMGKKYELNGSSETITTRRIDVPILVGKKLAIVRLYTGPVFSAYFNENISIDNIDYINTNNFSVGVQLGAGVNLKKFRIDLRLDQSISGRTLQFSSGANQFKLEDNRPRLLLLSVGYELF